MNSVLTSKNESLIQNCKTTLFPALVDPIYLNHYEFIILNSLKIIIVITTAIIIAVMVVTTTNGAAYSHYYLDSNYYYYYYYCYLLHFLIKTFNRTTSLKSRFNTVSQIILFHTLFSTD